MSLINDPELQVKENEHDDVLVMRRICITKHLDDQLVALAYDMNISKSELVTRILSDHV